MGILWLRDGGDPHPLTNWDDPPSTYLLYLCSIFPAMFGDEICKKNATFEAADQKHPGPNLQRTIKPKHPCMVYMGIPTFTIEI